MYRLHGSCRQLVAVAAFAGCFAVTASAQEENLVGTWTCDLSAQDPESGMTIQADFEHTYNAAGTYERSGRMSFNIPVLQADLSLAIEESGTWRLVDSTVLAETTTEIQFSSGSETPSQMEQMMLAQMQAAAEASISEEQIVELKSLTATTLEFEDDEGVVSICQKA